jgi:thioesterase domain-containing protein
MSASAAAGDALAAEWIVDPVSRLTSNGVRLEQLRTGRVDARPLFMVPGLEGNPAELTALASALIGSQSVYALSPLLRDAEERPILSIVRIAELMVAAIRQVHPSGPYRLGGYSFGALVALEMAQQLRGGGDVVEALFLIEPVYDERYWPRGIWVRALGRRTGRHLLRMVRMHPTQAIGELRVRGVRLFQRVMRRTTDAPDLLPQDAPAKATMSARAVSALSDYPPRFFDGRMMLIASSIDRHFGCDTVRLWDGYAHCIDVRRVNADHVTIMHEPASASVASVIDHSLALMDENWSGLRPRPGLERPMILTTMRWFSAARLAHALSEAGFSVSACHPRAHVLGLVEGLTSDSRLSTLRPMPSLVRAIRRANPDIILPDDERALVLLRRLHHRVQTEDPGMAALIARSLGNIEDWSSIGSRTALMSEAARLRIPVPATQVIESAAALRAWEAEGGLPVVLKTDGSWGGRGVAIVRDRSDLRRAWRTMSGPPGFTRALKRTLSGSDCMSLAMSVRRVRPVVNAQQFVNGREAIASVACADGEVLAIVCLEVVQAMEPKGPAAVVRIIDHPAMAEAARRLVGRFGLSGFCGFDFMMTDAGDVQLIELNPRVTPTCHLLVEGGYPCGQPITLFPADVDRSPEPGTGGLGVLDAPVRAPSLVDAGQRDAARKQRPVSRMASRLTKKFSPLPY